MNETPGNRRPKGWLSRHHKQGKRPWRRFRLMFLRWRRGILANPHTARAYRMIVGGLGTLVVLIGLVLVPFPGPGWLIVIIGLFIISSEFHWARRLLHFVREKVESWTHWLLGQPLWVRWSVAGATALFVGLIVWGAVRIIGLPDWVPDLDVLEYLELQ